MKVHHGLNELPDASAACVMAIGNFDGVHCGHQEILRRGKATADAARLDFAAMTFDPHPLSIVAPTRAPEPLIRIDEKLKRFKQFGVDTAIVARSEPGLLSLTPEQFIVDVVMPKFAPTHFVEGRSFGFGKDRKGNVDVLAGLGTQHGFVVEVVEPIQVCGPNGDKLAVSSSAIRGWLREGKVHLATAGLGRPYTLVGQVGRGDARGKTLGFPTANLTNLTQLIPAEGVYAGMAEVGGQRLTAAVSVGKKPTFDGAELTVEAFLLDFDETVYDQAIALSFIGWVRGQRKFDSAKDLQAQISEDVEQVQRICRETEQS